ncbi:amino acid ABC transporter permease [Ancylobacter sp. A5.8]|uniref:amino acid ABC transporter permease n=1 Tax=Ancylobacter gelatini TaxID=2919920 RepID=UPI001F4D527F|nr:amino acid ABC transporter permease [Ancylobacter gelatini]MCJ8142856.1 amino acid ABC transporter permease [Ancylobacter gelatini]
MNAFDRAAAEAGVPPVRRPRPARASWMREVLLLVAVLAVIALPLALVMDFGFIGQLDFGMLYAYREALLRGSVVSIGLTVSAMGAGLAVGILLAVAARGRSRLVRAAVTVHVELWRNTPILIQLFWVHFGLPLLTGLSTSVLVSGLIAMTLQASAYLTEVARAGIAAIPSGQWEAARALGLSPPRIWQKVILPQALRLMIPPGTNTLLSVFKGSAVLSVLSVGELMSVSQHIANYTFKPIETLSIVALLYFLTGKVFTSGMALLERRARMGS